MTKISEINKIPVDFESDHMDAFSDERGVYFNTGFTLLASSENHDILLWTCVYKIRNMGTIYQEEGRQLTTLSIVPKDRRGKGIFDNNFIRSGWHSTEALKGSDVQVVKEGDKIIYKVESRTYTHRPPVWEVRGAHAGVELDITYRQICPLHWILGASFEKMPEVGAAMYDVLCSADGEIRVDGKTFPIKNGFGVHEHGLLSLPQWDLYALYEAPNEHTWVNLRAGDLRLWFFQWTKNNMEGGRLWVDGKDITYKPHEGKGNSHFTVLKKWFDPRSGLCVPCQWHLLLSSAEGTLELTLAAQARHYYHPLLRNGELMWMWFLCLGNGAFYFPDGRAIPVKDTLVCVEWGRSVLAAKETLAGPEL